MCCTPVYVFLVNSAWRSWRRGNTRSHPEHGSQALLFPSRTRKSSSPAPMILRMRESRSLPGFFLFFPSLWNLSCSIFIFREKLNKSMLAFLLTETAHLSVPQLKSRVARSCWQQTRTHHVSAVQRADCISAVGTLLLLFAGKNPHVCPHRS